MAQGRAGRQLYWATAKAQLYFASWWFDLNVYRSLPFTELYCYQLNSEFKIPKFKKKKVFYFVVKAVKNYQ